MPARPPSSAQMVRTFPAGRFAERAAWKAGWWAYRQRSMADAVQFFEIGAAELPALGLPSVVALLERPREGTTGRRLRRCGPLHPRGDRLPEQLLRPAGAAADGQAVGAALDSREPGAAADAAAHASPDRLAAVARPQRPGARRDPVRPPHLGRFAGPGRDHRAGPAPRRPPAPRHQRHEARLPAVPRGRRRVAAARGDARPLPAGLLAGARGRRGQARPRQVPGRRARRAGIDLRRPDPLVGRRHRPDADHARHRPRLRPADGHQAVQHRPADRPLGQRRHRHAVPGRPGRAVRRRAVRAGRLQRRRAPRRALARRAAGPARGRVDRRHPVPRDAELRQAHPRHGGRLPASLRRRRARAAADVRVRGHADGDTPAAAPVKAKPAAKAPPAKKKRRT